MDRPLVSICCITYNHARYIAQAIESFLFQKTNFAFEIIINDDASTDGTTEIIEDYRKRYPEIIFPVFQKTNLYSKGIRGMNPRFTFPIARGKYIAMCEGDDYWMDPWKLQKQVDFLEVNSSYVITFHDAKVINEMGKVIIESKLGSKYKCDCSSEQILYGHAIPTLTALFRNYFTNSDFKVKKAKNGDTVLFSYLAQFGGGKFLDNIEPAVYRVHQGGVWSSLGYREKIYNAIVANNEISEFIRPNYKYIIEEKLLQLNIIHSFLSKDDGNKIKHYFSSYRYFTFNKRSLVRVVNAHRAIFSFFLKNASKRG